MGDTETGGMAAVAEAMTNLAEACGVRPEQMPALAHLKRLAARDHDRAEITRRAWLTLSAALHEAADEAERMAD